MQTSVTSGKIPQERPEFWDILGGVRFGLASIVVIAHLSMFQPAGVLFRHVGYLSATTAVFCFLVLSGFSIAASLAKDANHFYRRRALRIYPLYFLTIMVCLVFARKMHITDSLHVHNVVANLFFLQTFAAQPLPINGVVWSLAVEAACYIAAPFLHKLTSFNLMGIAGVSAVAFLYFPWLHLHYYAWLPFGGALLFLGWAWLAGFIYYRHRHDAHSGIILLATMIILTSVNTVYTSPWQHITIAGSIALLVVGKQITLGRLSQKVLAYLGNLSYPLYLIHLPLFRLFHDQLNLQHETVYIGAALTAAAIGLVVDAKLRRPCAAAIDRLDQLGNQMLQVGRLGIDRFVYPLAVPPARLISVGVATLGFAFYMVKARPPLVHAVHPSEVQVTPHAYHTAPAAITVVAMD